MAIVKKYKAEIVDIKNHTENIYTVEFKSQTGTFKFQPGQFLHLALDEYDPSSNWPESRCFSIQTPPDQKTIKITFAVKGIFTKRMENELKLGKIINLKLPYGSLFQEIHDKTNYIFIAGGTGITPYLSLFNDLSFSTFINPILYFGFRNKKHDLYDKELSDAQKINITFNVYKVNQETEGMLNISDIYKIHSNGNTYFISGPQIMISNFKKYLLDKGVKAINIITDDWE